MITRDLVTICFSHYFNEHLHAKPMLSCRVMSCICWLSGQMRQRRHFCMSVYFIHNPSNDQTGIVLNLQWIHIICYIWHWSWPMIHGACSWTHTVDGTLLTHDVPRYTTVLVIVKKVCHHLFFIQWVKIQYQDSFLLWSGLRRTGSPETMGTTKKTRIMTDIFRMLLFQSNFICQFSIKLW